VKKCGIKNITLYEKVKQKSMWYCPDYSPPACSKEEVERIFYRWITRFEKRIDGEFAFHEGMRFGAHNTWWGRSNPRRMPHEGLDFCTYRSTDGKYKRLLPGQEIEPVETGELVAHFPDFIGNTVILRHPDLTTEEGMLHSVYGHVRLVTSGDTLKILISGSVTRAPPHLHLSLFYKDPPSKSASDEPSVESWDSLQKESLFMYSPRRSRKLSGVFDLFNIAESCDKPEAEPAPGPKTPEIVSTDNKKLLDRIDDIVGDANCNVPSSPASPRSLAYSDKCLSFSDDPVHKATDWACGYLPLIELAQLNLDDHILDVGCGLGGLCHYLVSRCKFKHVIGLDVSARLLKQAQEYATEGLSFHLLDNSQDKPLDHWRETEMSGALADCIFCCFVLSGFPDEKMQREFLAQLASALKPTGQCIILVNNPRYYGTRFSSIQLSKIPRYAGGVPLSPPSSPVGSSDATPSLASAALAESETSPTSLTPKARASFTDGERVRLEMYDIGKTGSGFRLVSYDRYWSEEHYINVLKSAGFKQVTAIELKYGTQFDAELNAIGISPKSLRDSDVNLAPILALRGTV